MDKNRDPAFEDTLARLTAQIEHRRIRPTGREVGVFGLYVPLELLLALGLEPVVLTAGGSPGAMQDAEPFVRADACPLVRSQVGLAGSAVAGWERLALIVAFAACDQEMRMLETLRHYRGVNAVVAATPRTRSPNAWQRYRDDLAHLVAEISHRFETRLESAALARAVSRVRELRTALRGWRPRLEFADFALLVQGCFQLGVDPALAFLAELETHSAAPVPPALSSPPAGPGPRAPVRLLLTGSCVASDDLVFVRELARLGADVVEDTTRLVGGLLDVEVPPAPGATEAVSLDRVARAYFFQPDIAARPNDAFYEALAAKLARAPVDGVIHRCLKFCDVHAGEQRRIREALAPRPVLFLDDEYDAAARPRRRTRVEAFLEMIRCRTA